MWQIDNRTPFAADRGWVRDRQGAEIWLVAVKATFDIAGDGRTEVAAMQPPVLRVAEHHGEPGASSLKYDADLVLTKKTTDVLVVGHAYAAGGRMATEMNVGFKVGPVQKVLRVCGDRTWTRLGASAAQPFERIPLVYERAYGGSNGLGKEGVVDCEWRNPVGVGYGAAARAPGAPLPNVEYPDTRAGSAHDRAPPAGFGAIACHWQPRAALAGTYDDHWMQTRQPLLAEDLDDRHFQCSPVDQQSAEFLRGGESVALRGLTSGGALDFRLPKLYLGFETHFTDGTREIHKTKNLHTVIIEPDFPRVSIVWHSALPCHWRVHKLERTIVSMKTGPEPRPLSSDAPEMDLE